MKTLILFSFMCAMNPIMLVDFTKQSSLEDWYVVNDGVMGGLSEGEMFINEDGNALFQGAVRLENNGGFTSIRHRFARKEIKGKTHISIRVKGDGKRYQFRVKSELNDWHSYIYYFETSGEWETIEIPMKEMYPSFRGRKLPMPNFDVEYLNEVSILIANYKAESFQLEIDHIQLKSIENLKRS